MTLSLSCLVSMTEAKSLRPPGDKIVQTYLGDFLHNMQKITQINSHNVIYYLYIYVYILYLKT